ncbi:MAG TPA: aminotransferase class I/II-fold pyridoxal phosphate-dependent enzyme [archaeon]|nr:aminotransferase class I/II-fold pyridoxal phosphate-dependent enzyme [archaeon]
MKTVVPAQRTLNVRHANRDLVPVAQGVEKGGKKVLYLNTGDPIPFDFRAPFHLWELINERKREAESYTNALGSDNARAAVASYAKKVGAKNVSKEDVVNFVGGGEAIKILLDSLLDRGENILLPKPGYSVYNGELVFLEAIANEYELDEENDWQVNVPDLEKKINSKSKAIVLINPGNPTGGLLSKSNLKDVVQVAAENNLPIICDETYDQIIYEGSFSSIASVAKEVPVISLGCISKNYMAPGFRGGWIYKQDSDGKLDEYFEAIKRLCRLRLTNSGMAQIAIEAALNGPQDHIPKMISKLKKRRDFAYKRISEIRGLSTVNAKGSFYLFPKISLKIKSDKEFVLKLLRETGVLVTHGEGFGQKEGTHHFRMVFLPPEKTLDEAFNLIEGFIKKNY